MPSRNKYLDSVIPFFYQRSIMDAMIYTFIDTYKLAQPSISIKEAAQSFVIRHKIPEDLHSLTSIITTYERTCKDYNDAKKQQK